MSTPTPSAPPMDAAEHEMLMGMSPPQSPPLGAQADDEEEQLQRELEEELGAGYLADRQRTTRTGTRKLRSLHRQNQRRAVVRRQQSFTESTLRLVSAPQSPDLSGPSVAEQSNTQTEIRFLRTEDEALRSALALSRADTLVHYDAEHPYSFPPIPAEKLLGDDAVSHAEKQLQVAYNLKNEEIEGLEEPPLGMFPASLDTDRYTEARKRQQYLDYKPTLFKRRLPAMRHPRQIPPEQQLLSEQRINKAPVDGVFMIALLNLKMDAYERGELCRRLARFRRTEVLILRNLKIKRIDDLKFKVLRWADFASNGIYDMNELIAFFRKSRYLEVLDMRGNPVCSIGSFRLHCIYENPHLHHLNKQPVTLAERFAAIEKFGSPEERRLLPMIRWDRHFSAVPAVQEMDKWRPNTILSLALPARRLQVFHVGPLRMLRELDLSNNMIQDIHGAGLERCECLVSLNLANNLIRRREALEPLTLVPSLQQLRLDGNKIQDYRLQVIYMCRNSRGTNRSTGLSELDKVPVSLDERFAAVEAFSKVSKADLERERWRSVIIATYGHRQLRQFPNFKAKVPNLIIPAAGLTIADVTVFCSIVVLDLSGNDLRTVQGLDHLPKLRILNLSDNPNLVLEPILKALECTASLRQVFFASDKSDITGSGRRPTSVGSAGRPLSAEFRRDSLSVPGSPPQSPKKSSFRRMRTSSQSGSTSRMDELRGGSPKRRGTDGSAGSSPGKDRRGTDGSAGGHGSQQVASPVPQRRVVRGAEDLRSRSTEYRLRVISRLVPHHARLDVLDRTWITVDERVQAYRLGDHSVEACARHRFLVSVMVDTVAPACRIFDEESLEPGEIYDALKVTKLEKLRNCGLHTAGVDLSPFVNLVTLDLSHNFLSSIAGIGLPRLRKLKICDLSFNKIEDSPQEIAKVLDKMPRLEILALRGNPCMKKDGGRARSLLLGSMKQMREVTCTLRVVDTDVTLAERVEGWRKSGISEDECEMLRYKATVFLRAPVDVSPDQLTSLDLNDAELRRLDLTGFPQLRVLLLRKNTIASLSHIVGLDTLQLELLDLRDNALTDLDEAAAFVEGCTSLSSVGLSGNPFAGCKNTAAYRAKLLAKLPGLCQPESVHLQFLDETEIVVDELIAIWRASKTGRHADPERFRFETACFRKAPLGVPAGKVAELNLANLKLSFLRLNTFAKLEKLSLSANEITDEVLADSEIALLKGLVALDLRRNRIAKLDNIVRLVDRLPTLRVLFVSGNPAFADNNDPALRLRLLASLSKAMDTDLALENLNGKPVTVDERCAALQQVAKERSAEACDPEQFRTELCLHRLGADAESARVINLSANALTRVNAVVRFQQLTHLDLSRNALQTLQGQDLSRLPHLRVLDLRHNKLPSLEHAIGALSWLGALRFVWLKNSCRNAAEASDPVSYAPTVLYKLKGLEAVDGYENPDALKEHQLKAIAGLQRMTGQGGKRINPNRLLHVDLSGLSLEREHFLKAVKYMSTLPILTLRVDDNPWTEFPHYRYIVMHHMPDLDELDGSKITMNERANAERTIRKMRKTRDKVTGVVAIGVDAKVGGATVAGMGGAAALGAGGSAAAGARASTLEIDEETAGMAQVEQVVRPTGSLLTKFEILVNYFQILALITTLVTIDLWPNFWVDLSWLPRWVFTLDFNLLLDFDLPLSWQYIQFTIFMLLPPLFFALYKVPLSKEKWRKRYVEKWVNTRRRALMVLGGTLGAILFLSYVLDFPNNREHGFPSAFSQAFLLVFGLTALLLYLFWLRNVMAFRRHDKDPDQAWWFSYCKYKERLGLFLLTIFYMPIARTLFYSFRCDDNEEHLLLYPNEPCPKSVDDVAPIQVVSVFLMPLYLVGIPLFFVSLIRRGVSEIDRNTDMGRKLAVIRKLEMDFRDNPDPAIKERLREAKEDAKYYYAHEARHYEASSSYLYTAYERKFRFYKVVQMMEKIALLILASFVGFAAVQVVLGAGVVGAFTMVAMAMRPFSDGGEDVMDLSSRAANSLNIAVGLSLDSGWVERELAASILAVGNLLNVLVLLAGFVAGPIRGCLAVRQATMEEEARLRAMVNDGQSNWRSRRSSRGSSRIEMRSLISRDTPEPDMPQDRAGVDRADRAGFENRALVDTRDVHQPSEETLEAGAAGIGTYAVTRLAAGRAMIAREKKKGNVDEEDQDAEVVDFLLEAQDLDDVLDSGDEEYADEYEEGDYEEGDDDDDDDDFYESDFESEDD